MDLTDHIHLNGIPRE